MSKPFSLRAGTTLVSWLALAVGAAHAETPGLLFALSGDHGLTADVARGEAQPNILNGTKILKDGTNPYLSARDSNVVSWLAPGNIYSKRGTLSFRFRARDPLGPTPFPIFRVGFADHSSWDMTFLRIDWNGDGFDAFVTDANLSRVRVSYKLTAPISPDAWTKLTFTWDESGGVVLYVDGKRVAANPQPAVLDVGLDQFGPFARTISPHQVHSADEFTRGGDIDDIAIYDHALSDAEVTGGATAAAPLDQAAWLHNNGWDIKAAPVVLTAPATRIRKVEFADALDLKEHVSMGVDGIDETTWPGVYNRSSLTGRHDYFTLPDWNVYVEGGKTLTLKMPAEPFNHVEITGAAYGNLTYQGTGAEQAVAKRAKGTERTWNDITTQTGGTLRFTNDVQETPIQDIAAFNITPDAEPDEFTLSYKVNAGADVGAYPALDDLTAYIAGRYLPEQRTTVVALPKGAPQASGTARGTALPFVNILIPNDFRLTRPGGNLLRFGYGWGALHKGLDGIALDIPALKSKPDANGLIPLNIRIKDPLWPGRNLLDVTIAVKPGEARTVFLDTRDRILPDGKSLYLTVASAAPDFDATTLDGMAVRLKFKTYEEASKEHIADRFAQARDNLAWLVEEHTASLRMSRYARLEAELTDLLKVDPDNVHGREMWANFHPEQGWPDTPIAPAPAGVPQWAWLQTQDLKRNRQFAEWWIDNRQVPYGDFGGGISDDDDLTQQWPGIALMGDIPDKLNASVMALSDAAFKNGMFTGGLNTIKTDSLHTYEEGINAESETMYLNYGDPKVVERLMATAHDFPKVVQQGKDGKTYFISHYFSATSASTDEPWNWTELYSPLILHPGLLLGDYNNDPKMRAMVVALADNYVDRGKQDAKGNWRFPAELNSQTGEARGTMNGGGSGYLAFVQLFWAAYKWTGDAKYLRPLQSANNFGPALTFLNADVLPSFGDPKATYAKYKTAVDGGDDDPFSRYQAWRGTGDIKYLEDAFRDDITDADRHMWMFTEAQWWIDRVELDSQTLQRTRLGGVALRRGQTYPGHLVSWRFDTPTMAENVGLLVSEPSADHFKVTAVNLTTAPVHAVMTGWDITAGQWKVTGPQAQTLDFERSKAIDLTLAPGQSEWEFTLVKAGDPTGSRYDLGIGKADVKASGSTISVTIHSLGAKPAPASVLVAEDATGHEVGRTAIPPLAAPLDQLPKTAVVRLKTRQPWARLRILTPEGQSEITQLNNVVVK